MRKAAAALALLAVFPTLCSVARAASLGPAFSLRVPANVRSTALTGRAYVFVTRRGAKPEPRLQYHGLGDSIPFFGIDIDAVAPGEPVTLDANAEGYPVPSLRDLPAGEYDVQALANVYTRFPRADGHVIWAHDDRGEGQQFNISPGNLISEVKHVRIDPRRSQNVELSLSKQIPPIVAPPDTAWVKRVRIQSRLLTAFWGVPMYLGATVLLPRGYDANPAARYATVYEQGHFDPGAPFGFDPGARMPGAQARAARLAQTNRESAYEFTQAWLNGDAPPLAAVLFTHPTPYYDDSYAVNSANNGPYGDALLTELIPYLETHFRLAPHGDARFLIGGSTGGWEALALQIFHPGDFNGAWGLYPDPLDFHRFQIGDMYGDASAFSYAHNDWIHAEIPAQRNADGTTYATMREESRLELVLGTHGRSAEQFNAWDAAYGPVGTDGYPQEMWNKRTGVIHHDVVDAMRASGFDLDAYLAQHWNTIGSQLTGKLHVDVGDDDSYFLNLACYRLQAFLDAQTAPAANATFTYGRPMKPHGWQAKTTLNYLKDMAARAPS